VKRSETETRRANAKHLDLGRLARKSNLIKIKPYTVGEAMSSYGRVMFAPMAQVMLLRNDVALRAVMFALRAN